MPNASADFISVLKTLSSYKVNYIVVGGVCAVLHGAPVTTFDVDVLYSMDDENLVAVEEALLAMGAYYRGRGSQRLLPGAKQLKGGGHHLFASNYGPLDLLSFVGENHTYSELINRCETIFLEEFEIKLLGLSALIEVKMETMREKDEVHLRILKRLQDEQNG